MSESTIWNFLKQKGLSDCGAAGLMGNLYAESGLKSTNLQNSYEKKLGFSDEDYTAQIDAGIYRDLCMTAPAMAWLSGHSGAENRLCFPSR